MVQAVGFRPAVHRLAASLGLGEPIPVSAIHGRGSGDLLDLVVDALPPAPEDDEGEEPRAFAQGRPADEVIDEPPGDQGECGERSNGSPDMHAVLSLNARRRGHTATLAQCTYRHSTL